MRAMTTVIQYVPDKQFLMTSRADNKVSSIKPRKFTVR